MAKDATSAFNDVYEFASAVRAGTLDWSDIEKGDMNTRLKWVGLVHRDKRTPGRFMMRLRLPNGITNANSFRFYADSVEPYGPDLGVVDITTRQNIQLRGVTLGDADKIIDGLHERGQTRYVAAESAPAPRRLTLSWSLPPPARTASECGLHRSQFTLRA
jgi:ferredoxin-nitrite reductase